MDASSQEDDENGMALNGSKILTKRTSPTKEVDDLNVEVSTNEDETESMEDIQDVYNQLDEECLKEKKRILLLSMRLKMNEDYKKTLHVDLLMSKAQVCGIEKEEKSLKDKLSFLELLWGCRDKEMS
ncbi:unnamed protein product [Ilex paraguariensis]|uniref:Uncharacterized protein n=1 Tax=Ilex paraguariensis TaxID=185542 RepID=A0ABC8TA84_9AQUA